MKYFPRRTALHNSLLAIGTQYVVTPRTATRSFGLPLPEDGANIAWWLRLKGVRDIVSGLTVLAFMAWGIPRGVGIILLVEAIIPMGDMLVILAATGSTKSAFGMHGVTAVLMVFCSHSHDDWCVLRWSMLFQSGYSLPASLARASITRSALPRRKVISRGGLPALVEQPYRRIGDGERRSDCASCQSHCWPGAWSGNHFGCGYDRSTPPRSLPLSVFVALIALAETLS
jgi:hypothetical protein